METEVKKDTSPESLRTIALLEDVIDSLKAIREITKLMVQKDTQP